MGDTVKQANHQIIMQNRGVIDLTDVLDVDSFDDTTVLVSTTMGELTIRGHDLQVNRLNLECGTLSVEGKVDTLSYSEPSRGLFGRLLR